MPLRVVEHYLHKDGLPSWGGNGTPFGAIGGHSSESAAGEQALWDVLAWMVATAEQRGASYHEYHAWVPEKPDDYLVVKAIPASRAAGSVAIRPGTLALDDWARASLNRSGNANDPNQGIYAVCIIGKSAVIRDVWAKDRRFVGLLHQRLMQIRGESLTYQPQLPLDRIVEHFRFNPTTRSDWGRLPINLTLEQRQAPAAERTRWHSALCDALGATRTTIPERLPEAAVELPYFKPNTGTVRAGATFRDEPGGNAVGELVGGPIVILSEVPAGAPRWFQVFIGVRSTDGATDLGVSVPDRIGWVARGDVTVDASPINLPFVQRVGAAVYSNDPIGADDTAALEAALNAANARTASVKTKAAELLRKGAAANRDTATGLEAAAKNVETL